jgi:hypothetical protein
MTWEVAMTTTLHEQSAVQTPRESWTSRVFVPEMWATVSIVAMWIAVLVVGVYGGTITFHAVDSSWSTIPAGVPVAMFAAIGTVSVAKRVFGRTKL